MLDSIVLDWKQLSAICAVVSTVVSFAVKFFNRELKRSVTAALLKQTADIAESRAKMVSDLRAEFVPAKVEERDLLLMEKEVEALKAEIQGVKDMLMQCQKWCLADKTKEKE